MIDLSAGRNVVNIDADSLRARRRRIFAAIGRNGMYPMDAPGMPPPGPDFLAHAKALGDGTVFKKQSGKKGDDAVVFQPGELLEKLYLRALREPGFTMPIEVRKGQEGKAATFIPGHIWGQHMASYHASLTELGAVAVPVDGPQPADVMIIGKMPWDTELTALRNFVGPTGDKLYECLQQARVDGVENFYITNLIKFMPPDGSSTIKANWLADCLPLLHQELRIVRPRFILFLGADATKAILGSGTGVTNMQGRVVPFTYPVHLNKADEPEMHTAHCMTVTHPAQVTRDVTLERGLVQGLSRFKLLLSGAQFKDSEDNIDHRVFSVLEDALEYLQECSFILKKRVAAGLPRWVAWDAEWHGQQPINAGSYLRTVQISVAPFTAGTFMLRNEDGKRCFVDRHGKRAEDRLVAALNQFMRDKWAVGHFLVADLAWLEASGIHLLERFEVPLHGRNGKQAWELLMDGVGGFDTGMAAHSLEETAVLGLDTLCMRYTEVPPYWVKLEEWIVQYCKEQGIPRRALEGYGMVPDEVLLPYANYDADATLRLALKLRDYLSDDYNHNNCWESFWEKMTIQPVWLEMSQNGVCVDRQRIDRLTFMFLAAREKIEAHITNINAWPKFNIRSVQHVKEFLFGHELNGKVTDDGKPLRLRPDGAVSLRVEPLLTTSKPPKRWSDIVEQNRQADFSPSTGKMVLAILAQDHLKTTYRMPDGTIGNVGDRIQEIRNYRKVDQVLKGFLRPPEIGEDGLYITGDDGEYTYESGLAFCIDKDGRVRTHFGLAETGRWRSFRPNMQNWSKTADKDLAGIVGKDIYKEKLRSILRCGWPDSVATGLRKGKLKWSQLDELALQADPAECWVGIECDYIGAELYGMAIMAGDDAMIEHCQRNQLKESDPLFYDIHSSVAVLAFRLTVNSNVHKSHGKPCNEVLGLAVGTKLPATKTALECAGFEHLRTIAKNVIFGIAYGRGAKAIALAAKEQGINISVEDAQAVIDTIFRMYPRLQPFFEQARKLALEKGWLCHCYGGLRRFPHTNDFVLAGEFERQAMNFPIQGMIASALNRGVACFRAALRQQNIQQDVRILLAIHDALVVECRPYLVDHLARKGGLLEWAMCKQTPIYPTNLVGKPTGKGPYFLGLDVSVFEHWSEKIPNERCKYLGIPECYGEKPKIVSAV